MQVPTRNIWWWWLRKFPKVIAEIFFVWEGYLGDTSEKPSIKEHHSQIWRIFVEPKVELGKCIWKSDNYTLYVPSSKHGIWAMAMVIHPILGIITMGILNPIDGCMTIPLYEKTNHVLTTAHININKMISKKKHFQIISRTAFSPSEGTIFRTFQPRHKSWCSSPKSAATALCWNRSLSVASMTKMDKDEAPKKIWKCEVYFVL